MKIRDCLEINTGYGLKYMNIFDLNLSYNNSKNIYLHNLGSCGGFCLSWL